MNTNYPYNQDVYQRDTNSIENVMGDYFMYRRDKNPIRIQKQNILNPKDTTSALVLDKRGFQYNIKPETYSGIYTTLYMLIFIFILCLIKFQQKGLPYIFTSIFVEGKKLDKEAQERFVFKGFFYFGALTLSMSVLSIGLMFMFYHTVEWIYIFNIAILLVLYHVFIIIMTRWIGWTFDMNTIYNRIHTFNIGFNAVIGFMVFPVVIPMFFVNSNEINKWILVEFVVLTVMLLYKYFRISKLLFVNKISILYMILYLCAVELAPVFIIAKLLERGLL